MRVVCTNLSLQWLLIHLIPIDILLYSLVGYQGTWNSFWILCQRCPEDISCQGWNNHLDCRLWFQGRQAQTRLQLLKSSHFGQSRSTNFGGWWLSCLDRLELRCPSPRSHLSHWKHLLHWRAQEHELAWCQGRFAHIYWQGCRGMILTMDDIGNSSGPWQDSHRICTIFLFSSFRISWSLELPARYDIWSLSL